MTADVSTLTPANAPTGAAFPRRLMLPIAILIAEVTVLTPFVEFTGGQMSRLANPIVLLAALVSLTAFWLMVVGSPETRTANAATPSRAAAAIRWQWVGVHVPLFALFFGYTLWLHQLAQRGDMNWLLPLVWCLLGAGVCISIVGAFVSLTELARLARSFAVQICVAGTVGLTLLLMLAPVRHLWPKLNAPALAIVKPLLAAYPGDEIVAISIGGWPIVGGGNVSLLVTPPCSETEALFIFLLLAGTYWMIHWDRMSPGRFLTVLIVGEAIIYLLITLRLYFLILLGLAMNNVYASVNFAHSRLSSVLFLLLSLLILSVGGRMAVRPPAPAKEEELQEREVPEAISS